MYKRQNDPKAMAYLKASVYCHKKEKIAMYLNLLIAIGICVIGIFNRYYLFIPDHSMIILASGIILVMQCFFMIQIKKYKSDRAAILEQYDTYVFGLSSNSFVTGRVNDCVVERYSWRIKDKKNKLLNGHFADENASKVDNAVFLRQYRFFSNQFDLLNYVKIFYIGMYFIFFGLIMGVSLTFNDAFLGTLTNIFLPSISMIVLIITSWQLLNSQIASHQRAMADMDKIKADPECRMTGEVLLRSIQDGIIRSRNQEFIVPGFLVAMYRRRKNRRRNIERSITQIKNKPAKKEAKKATNMGIVKAPAKQTPKQTKPAKVSKPVKTKPAKEKKPVKKK